MKENKLCDRRKSARQHFLSVRYSKFHRFGLCPVDLSRQSGKNKIPAQGHREHIPGKVTGTTSGAHPQRSPTRLVHQGYNRVTKGKVVTRCADAAQSIVHMMTKERWVRAPNHAFSAYKVTSLVSLCEQSRCKGQVVSLTECRQEVMLHGSSAKAGRSQLKYVQTCCGSRTAAVSDQLVCRGRDEATKKIEVHNCVLEGLHIF